MNRTDWLFNELKLARLGDWLVRRNPVFYRRFRAIYRRLEHSDAEARREFTAQQLTTVLTWARATPYGRSVKRGLQIADWPLLRKETVLRFPHNHSRAGVIPAIRANTSGTTGQPLSLRRSAFSVTAEQAAIDHVATIAGGSFAGARIAILRADSIKDPSDLSPPFWIFAAGGSRLILSSHHLSRATIHDYADELKRFAPDVLWVYPTSLHTLCELLVSEGLEIRVPLVMSSSEVLATSIWALAQRALGCRIVDYYGNAERVAFAYATEPERFHFLPGYAHVELVYSSSDATHSNYEIVGTALWNRAMPLVRYVTGDLLRLPPSLSSEQLEDVCLGVREFSGIGGRTNDYLVLGDGRTIVGLNHLPRGVPNLLRMQIVQDELDRVRVLTIRAPAFSKADEEKLLTNIRQKIPDSVHIEIEGVSQLIRAPSGKIPFIVRSPSVRAEDSVEVTQPSGP